MKRILILIYLLTLIQHRIACSYSYPTEISKFILPPPCGQQVPVPDTIKFVVESISPNPTNGQVTVKYSAKEAGQLKVYGASLNTLSQYGIIRNSLEIIGDDQELTLDITQWQSGINSLIFEFNGDIVIENIVKN